MNLKVTQYATILELVEVMFNHKEVFNKDELKLAIDVCDMLSALSTQRKKTNEKTAQYIAIKRKTNKNYARGK